MLGKPGSKDSFLRDEVGNFYHKEMDYFILDLSAEGCLGIKSEKLQVSGEQDGH